MLKKSILSGGIASAVTILAFSFGLTALSMQFLNRPGWIVYDWLQRATALPDAPGVAMVLVDQHTLDQMAKAEKITFPFPRQLYGLVNIVGSKIGARGVLFDILFTEPSMYGPEDDKLFAKMLQDAKLPVFMPAASEKGFVKEPIDPIRRAITGVGGVHFKVDVDGVVRRAPPYLPGVDGDVLSLPEAIYQSIGKTDATDASLKLQLVPAERLLRFYQPQGIPYISFYDLVLAYRDLENGKPVPAEIQNLKDRVLIAGYSAPGLHDLKPIPTDNEAPGVLVPATALANRLADKGVTVLNNGTYLAISFGFLFALILIGSLIETPKLSSLIAGVFFPATAAAVTVGYWRFNVWFNPFPIELGILTAGGAQLLSKFYSYWADRRKFAKSLEYSMSPELVRLIRTGQLQVERYGEQRQITILFCDIVGFSRLSETLEARQLVTILNKYSDAAVDLIFKNQGYVDKFIGDAVMAFWGAPVPQTDHAAKAFEVALGFQSTLDVFNSKITAEIPHFPGLKVRVGLHTGSAIVGNIGARNRHNYTAIGDGVNLASRLEGLAKSYNCHLVMSEETVLAAKAKDHAGVFELDNVVVRGRTQPTRIFTFVGEHWPEEVAAYRQGLVVYYKGEWQIALKFFETAIHLPAAEIMAERCRRGLQEGKLKQWEEGVWYHERT